MSEPQQTAIGPQEGDIVPATAMLGEITWLMMHSEIHRYLFVVDLERLIRPALQSQQFKIYRGKAGKPVGYVSWAYLNPIVEKRFQTMPDQLRPTDWKSGEQPWIIEFLAPFGGTKEFVEDLRNNVFPDDTVYSLRPNIDGFGFRRIVWHGVNVENADQSKEAKGR